MEMIERVKIAISSTNHVPYAIQLIKLVAGEKTFELIYDDGEPEYYSSHGEALDVVVERRSHDQAKAAIQAMREPSEEMLSAQFSATVVITEPWKSVTNRKAHWQAMIDAALSPHSGKGGIGVE